MKKQICGAILAVLLIGLFGCAETADTKNTEQSAGAENTGWYTPYVAACVEESVVDPSWAEDFSPDESLKLDELQVILIRLYNRLNGGDGTIPPLPEDPLEYLQFWDATGNCVADIRDIAEVYAREGGLCVEFSDWPNIDELTLKMAFPGDQMHLCAQGHFVPEHLENETESHSAPGVLNMVLPGMHYDGTGIPDHYFFEVEGEIPADRYVHILSAYSFIEENGGFDFWDEWYYPYIYYWNFREGNYLTEATPREQEERELSPSDPAWREDLVLYLAAYCPDAITQAYVPEDKENARYTYSQNEAIQGLYQAGILTETDAEGNFDGRQPVTKAEVAAVIGRVLRPELRISN